MFVILTFYKLRGGIFGFAEDGKNSRASPGVIYMRDLTCTVLTFLCKITKKYYETSFVCVCVET